MFHKISVKLDDFLTTLAMHSTFIPVLLSIDWTYILLCRLPPVSKYPSVHCFQLIPMFSWNVSNILTIETRRFSGYHSPVDIFYHNFFLVPSLHVINNSSQ